MSARASIRLFESQTIPLVTEVVELTVSYFFVVMSLSFVRLEAIEGWVNTNGATLRWVTTYQSNVYQFAVQKFLSSTGGFQAIQNGLIPPDGAQADTVEYLVTDSDPESGTWDYRIAVLEYFNPAGAFMVRSLGPLELVVL